MFFLSCLLLSDPQYGTFYINVWKEILFAQVLYPFMAVRHNPELRRMNFSQAQIVLLYHGSICLSTDF